MSGTDTAVSAELAAIERQIGTPAYWRDEALQQRHRDLIDARESGAAPPAPASDTAREIAEINNLMRTDRRRYDRDLAMQQRYRDLIDAGDGSAPAPGDWRASPAQFREQQPELAARFDAEPEGVAGRLSRLQDVLQRVVVDIGDAAAADAFLATFQALPGAVKIAVQMQASAPSPGTVRPATVEQMTSFKTLAGGKEMIEGWGRRAHRSVATVFHRWGQIITALSASDAATFRAWFDAQPPRVQAALLWRLGAAD